jgi:hypothetical protein
VPALSVTFTVTPPSDVVNGSVAAVSPFNPVKPKMLTISSPATLADKFAAALTIVGSAGEVLALKLASPEYTATIECPITLDAALAASGAEARPAVRFAVAITELSAVSVNCALPVGVPLPGATAPTTAVSASWPEDIVSEIAVVVEACVTATVTVRLAADQELSPLY